MAPKKIVLQGFSTYGDRTINPSEMLVEALAATSVSGYEIVPYILRTSNAAVSEIPRRMAEIAPDFWLGIGLADGRTSVAIERVAINLCEFPEPDVDGETEVGVPCIDEGPPAYFTSIQAKAIARAWREEGIPGYVSYSAGTYLCNKAFYLASHAAHGSPTKVGFIHVPFLPEQVTDPRVVPSASFELQRKAIGIALNVLAKGFQDPEDPMGAIA